jgi:hypothetical protein
MLIGIYAVIWKFEKSTYLLKKQLIRTKLFLVLGVMAGIALMMVILDVATGVHPPFHLVTTLPPIASFMALPIIEKPDLIKTKDQSANSQPDLIEWFIRRGPFTDWLT